MSTESGVVRAWTSNRRARVGILGAIGAPALLLVATACATGASHLTSSPVSRTTNAPPTSSPSSPGPIVVEAHNQRYGAILTTTDGFALYQYSGDRAGGHGCTAACLASRPPLLLPAGKTRPVPGPGVTGLGTEPRGPRLQVTYRGLPLYRDITDTRPGQVTGANAVDGGGKWLLAIVAGARPAPTTPAGVATTRPQPSSPSTTQVQGQNTPATSPPARVAPVTRPPMTQAPVMRAPVTPPPVTRPPVTPPPVTRPPSTSPPTHPPTTPPPTVPPPPVY